MLVVVLGLSLLNERRSRLLIKLLLSQLVAFLVLFMRVSIRYSFDGDTPELPEVAVVPSFLNQPCYYLVWILKSFNKLILNRKLLLLLSKMDISAVALTAGSDVGSILLTSLSPNILFPLGFSNTAIDCYSCSMFYSYIGLFESQKFPL